MNIDESKLLPFDLERAKEGYRVFAFYSGGRYNRDRWVPVLDAYWVQGEFHK